MLYEKKKDQAVRCNLCGHRCVIPEGELGFCRVRKNIDGTLNSLVYGEVASQNIDPIEKKPLFHFLPGSKAFSIATVGCNFRCGFCQNWQISQVTNGDASVMNDPEMSPKEVVELAEEHGCESIAYTYTEPTIFFEFAYDIAVLASKKGLSNIFVTNGYMTPEAIDTIGPYLDAANVDLKSFRDEFYVKTCKARLQPVLDSIKMMKARNIWVEVTTMVLPGLNDSEEELNDIAEFIADVDPRMPWHISRFHPDYRYTDEKATPVETLRRAIAIGKKRGLANIYLGNVAEGMNTYCGHCGKLLLARSYFGSGENNIHGDRCPDCNTPLAGVW